MKVRPSDLICHNVGRGYTEYVAPNGLKFTYHIELNRVVLDDGSHSVYVMASDKVAAKRQIVHYLNHGQFDQDNATQTH